MSAMGGSVFLQSALCQSSPSSRCYSPLTYPSHRKVARKRRASVISYFWNGGRSFDERYSVRRRVVLLVGISVLPLFQFREVAAEEPVEAIDAVSNVGGFANIFLSQRNRSKVVKPLRTNILDKSAFEGFVRGQCIRAIFTFCALCFHPSFNLA